MRTSDRGLKLITQREGKVMRVYKDSKGLPTAGVGHLLLPAEKKAMPVGTPITETQCQNWLKADLAGCEEVVNGIGAKLAQNEFDACVSLAFNIGESGFARSTVARRLKAGDHKGAASAILLWNKPPEIQGRRRGEYHQFLTPYTSTAVSTAHSGETAPSDNPPIPADANTQAPPSIVPPQEPNQTIVDVPPVATEPPEGIVSKIKTWYAALPAFLLSLLGGFWSWLQGAATEIIVAFLVSAGIVAVVYIFLNYRSRDRDKQRDFDAKEKQKERDFELTKLQLLSAMDPNKQTVRVAPPPTVLPDVEG